MKRFKGKKGMICLFILMALVIGYYYYLSNHNAPKEKEVELTAVQDVLLRNLENDYPPTPKEVIKYYSELTKCVHNEDTTEEEMDALASKILELYDSELAANNPKDQFIADLKNEVTEFKKNDYEITSYAVASSTDVDFYEVDGFSFARLRGTYYIRVKNKVQSTKNIFLLRMDEQEHWKIYGWKQEQRKQAETESGTESE